MTSQNLRKKNTYFGNKHSRRTLHMYHQYKYAWPWLKHHVQGSTHPRVLLSCKTNELGFSLFIFICSSSHAQLTDKLPERSHLKWQRKSNCCRWKQAAREKRKVSVKTCRIKWEVKSRKSYTGKYSLCI